jgi:N-acetylglucosamine-6-phosphate deacetylase
MSERAQHAVAAGHVFDGETLHRDAAVVIAGTDVAGIVPRRDLATSMRVQEMPDGVWLAPGFIDTQVNGGGDVLFNDAPTPEGIRAIAAAHRKFGTTALLPTLISDTAEKMRAALTAAQAAVGVEPGVLGIHLEGPFLSPEKRGVHDPRVLRAPTREDSETLTAGRQGVMLVTLAPEQVPRGFIAELTGAGIRVALGHSMATYAQTRAAMAEGLTGFTHLFNAMRPLASREPGPIAAALESQGFLGMIVDGVHVDPAMLRLALRGSAHPMLVTDAMPPVGGSRADFLLYGETIAVREGRCSRHDGTLAGAFLDMASAVRNCVHMLGVPLTQALRFASRHPAMFLGLEHRLGKLAAGTRADIVAFAARDVRVVATWVAGHCSALQ